MAQNIEVHGADRLQSTLRAAGRKLTHPAATNRALANEIADGIRPPRRTGRLAASIRAEGNDDEARVYSNLVYAGVINYGWPRRNIRPARFMTMEPRTAVRAHRDNARDVLDTVKGA